MGELRILHIVDSVERGGAETLLVNTIKGIHSKYHSCKQYLVSVYSGGTLLSDIPGQVEYFNLGLTKFNFPLVIPKLNLLLKRLKIDVVHSHLLHSSLISRVALPSGVKLVSTYHSVFYDPDLVDFARKELFIDRLTYKDKYYSIFVSEAVKTNIAQAIGIEKNHSVLVNFASDLFKPSYVYKPEKELNIIMVGNLNPVKNHELAVKALSKFKDLPIRVDIYGEGALRQNLERLIRATDANVVLKGAKAMSSKILSEYDLFLMTSHHEGMPVSLLEAMQTGLPSLLNTLPMLKETAGDSAIYFDYDSLESLSKSILNIYNKKDILMELSQKALKRATLFSADEYIASLMKIYNNQIANS